MIKLANIIAAIYKHLPGKHNQQKHAGNREGTDYVSDIRISAMEHDILDGLIVLDSIEDVQALVNPDPIGFSALAGNLYKKIGVQNRMGAMVWALDNGVIPFANAMPFNRKVMTDRLSHEEATILQGLAAQRTNKQLQEDLSLSPKELQQALENLRERWEMPVAEPHRLVLAAIRNGQINLDDVNQLRNEDIAAGRTKGVAFVKVDGRHHRFTAGELKEFQNLFNYSGHTHEGRVIAGSQMSTLYSQTGATNTASLAVWGVRAGLIDLNKLPEMPNVPKLTATERHYLTNLAKSSYGTRIEADLRDTIKFDAGVTATKLRKKFDTDNMARITLWAMKHKLIDVNDDNQTSGG